MALVRVFTPQSASEQAVVVAMLEAHEIPTLVHNGHIASLLPGVVINAYNSSSIMVPEECVPVAAELIAAFRNADPSDPAKRSDSGLVLRNFFEFLLGGWFVPQRAVAPGPGGHARFVAFHEAPEDSRFRGEPLAFALTLARSREGIVLVFNKYRRVWELPGGLIDAGEGPRDAAKRELREEAGCEPRDLAWLGVTEVSDGRTFFGGVFACEVDVAEFVENEEIGGLSFWQPDRPPPGMGETDEALLERFGRR
jgi:8-oxo-dGTP diphosphatase